MGPPRGSPPRALSGGAAGVLTPPKIVTGSCRCLVRTESVSTVARSSATPFRVARAGSSLWEPKYFDQAWIAPGKPSRKVKAAKTVVSPEGEHPRDRVVLARRARSQPADARGQSRAYY